MVAFLLVTDLDNTLVGDREAMNDLNQILQQHRQIHGSKLVYASGRSRHLFRKLQQEQSLLEPDIFVGSVGTDMYYPSSDRSEPEWQEKLRSRWRRDRVLSIAAHFADLTPQPDSEQGEFKVSYYLPQPAAQEVLPRLEKMLQEADLDVRLVYSSDRDLDILPREGNKGTAMAFVRRKLGFSPENTIVCGDSGNDIGLFESGIERGIIVGNARGELLQWHEEHPNPNRYLAKAACAGGILEGLRYFGFV